MFRMSNQFVNLNNIILLLCGRDHRNVKVECSFGPVIISRYVFQERLSRLLFYFWWKLRNVLNNQPSRNQIFLTFWPIHVLWRWGLHEIPLLNQLIYWIRNSSNILYAFDQKEKVMVKHEHLIFPIDRHLGILICILSIWVKCVDIWMTLDAPIQHLYLAFSHQTQIFRLCYISNPFKPIYIIRCELNRSQFFVSHRHRQTYSWNKITSKMKFFTSAILLVAFFCNQGKYFFHFYNN